MKRPKRKLSRADKRWLATLIIGYVIPICISVGFIVYALIHY